jgi:hypothetical protein
MDKDIARGEVVIEEKKAEPGGGAYSVFGALPEEML